MNKKLLLLVFAALFSINSFAFINLDINPELRLQAEIYPMSNTNVDDAIDSKSAIGFGAKAEVYMLYFGLGAGFKTHSNSVSLKSETIDVSTTSFPVYLSARLYDIDRKDDEITFYAKGSLGYAFATQSSEGNSEKKSGMYSGVFVGANYDNFFTEVGFERSGTASTSFTVGVGVNIGR